LEISLYYLNQAANRKKTAAKAALTATVQQSWQTTTASTVQRNRARTYFCCKHWKVTQANDMWHDLLWWFGGCSSELCQSRCIGELHYGCLI